MCKTTQAKPSIQLNFFPVYAEERLLERYNPNSQSAKQLSTPKACVYSWCMMYFPSLCGGEVEHSPPCQFCNERQICFQELLLKWAQLYQIPGQNRSVLLRSCCRAGRHRPPSGFTSQKARWLLLMPFTFSLKTKSKFSQYCIFFVGGSRDGLGPANNLVTAQAGGLWEEIWKRSDGKGEKGGFFIQTRLMLLLPDKALIAIFNNENLTFCFTWVKWLLCQILAFPTMPSIFFFTLSTTMELWKFCFKISW